MITPLVVIGRTQDLGIYAGGAGDLVHAGYRSSMRDNADQTTNENDPAEEVEKPEEVWSPDELADEMSEESFPTSDPPSTWAGDDRG
jgi:hypothetical protein